MPALDYTNRDRPLEIDRILIVRLHKQRTDENPASPVAI